jgi:hypothetical protein
MSWKGSLKWSSERETELRKPIPYIHGIFQEAYQWHSLSATARWLQRRLLATSWLEKSEALICKFVVWSVSFFILKEIPRCTPWAVGER